MAMKIFSAFFFALLLLASPLLQVARCQSEAEAYVGEAVEGDDLGIVGEDIHDFGPAPGVETVCVFPKNSAKLVLAGEETELLVGMENVGESSVNVIAIRASVHFSFDHRMLVQNLTVQLSTTQLYPLQCKLLSLTYLLSASTYSLELLISWVRLYMKSTSSHSKVHSITLPLKLLKLVVSSALSPFFLLPLGSHFLFSWACGFTVNFSASPRKLRGLQRWKSGLGLRMHQWRNGFRERLTLNRLPNRRRRIN